MKKLAFLFGLVLFTLFSVNAQTTATDTLNAADIKFDKLEHDYGTITQNGNGDCEFTFTNTGKEPLVLTNVRSSCGCTVPSWPRQPILPGKSDKIMVKYSTSRLGVINKSITVESNAKTNPVTLKITGNVVAPPSETLPEKNVDQNSTPTPK
ncbi:MAG: DUF1573 domain-containing protein [Bacteroidetes bacterium]|nr:DUF1573 domain-containing protein [Bacteroidota bacterium]